MLVDDLDERGFKEMMKEEDYDGDDVEETKERASPFFNEDLAGNQAISLPNARSRTNSNNLNLIGSTDDEEDDDIVSKLTPLTDNQFSFCSAGQAM